MKTKILFKVTLPEGNSITVLSRPDVIHSSTLNVLKGPALIPIYKMKNEYGKIDPDEERWIMLNVNFLDIPKKALKKKKKKDMLKDHAKELKKIRKNMGRLYKWHTDLLKFAKQNIEILEKYKIGIDESVKRIKYIQDLEEKASSNVERMCSDVFDSVYNKVTDIIDNADSNFKRTTDNLNALTEKVDKLSETIGNAEFFNATNIGEKLDGILSSIDPQHSYGYEFLPKFSDIPSSADVLSILEREVNVDFSYSEVTHLQIRDDTTTTVAVIRPTAKSYRFIDIMTGETYSPASLKNKKMDLGYLIN